MIRWISFQSLIGGMMIGAERAFGSSPLFTIDYDGIDRANSSAYVNYMRNVRNLDFRQLVIDGDLLSRSQNFKTADDELFFKKECHDIDVVCAVPICSGLSQANTNKKGDKARGACAVQNNNMIGITEFTLSKIMPKVFIFENAPILASKSSESLRETINDIAKKYNYSVTYVKTNTNLHSNVQYRQRTFVIMWKDSKCPLLEMVNNRRGSIEEYLSDIDPEAPYQTEEYTLFKDFNTNTYIKYIKEKYGSNYRDCWERTGYLSVTNLIEGLNDFDFAETIVDDESRKFLEHIKKKRAEGKNYFDCGPIWYGRNRVPTIFGRTIDRLVHPTEERGYNIRELLKFMGMPDDFVFDNPMKNLEYIGQNVPVITAQDWCLQIKKFLDNELTITNRSIDIFDNIKLANDSKKKINVFNFGKKKTPN